MENILHPQHKYNWMGYPVKKTVNLVLTGTVLRTKQACSNDIYQRTTKAISTNICMRSTPRYAKKIIYSGSDYKGIVRTGFFKKFLPWVVVFAQPFLWLFMKSPLQGGAMFYTLCCK